MVSVHSDAQDPVIYTDGSVKKGEQSGWGFAVYINNKTVHTASGAIEKTTSSMRMEVEAITRALKWIAATRPQTEHLVVVTRFPVHP